MSLTRLAHQLVREHAQSHARGLAVDATCGNGHDTEFLARLDYRQVIAFDVQEQAIDNTQQRLQTQQLYNVHLIHQSHETLATHVHQAIDCCMFNLGYLPNADKTITTKQSSSIKALNATLPLLANNGIVSLLCYPGHPAGARETAAIKQWLVSLKKSRENKWQIETHYSDRHNESTPILFIVKPQ